MISAKDYVKKYTSVPSTFIERYFEFIDENTPTTELAINIDMVAKWLDVNKQELLRTLRKSYRRDIDYSTTNASNPRRGKYGNNYKRVLITADAFKNICMRSKSPTAQKVRDYFIEVENAFLRYRNEINEALTNDISRLRNNQVPLPSGGPGWIYLIKASDQMDSVYKLGRTKNLKRRIQEHSSARMDNVEIVFQYKVENVEAVESCAKAWLKEFKYRKYKEVYQVNADLVRKIVTKCASIGAVREYVLHQKPRMEGGYYMIAVRED